MVDEIVHLVYQNRSERLDKFLAESIPNLSRSQVKQLIDAGRVKVEGAKLKASSVLSLGTRVEVTLPTSETDELIPQDIPLDVLFEDDQLIALNKPAGLVTHPGPGNNRGTLVNGIIYHYPDIQALHPNRPGIVHRLDKDTSGIIVVGRTAQAVEELQAQFKARTVQKFYLALVYGRPASPSGLIDVPIGRHPQHRKRMAPLAASKSAQTVYQLLESFEAFSLLKVELKTGRTHQIRVHLDWLGHPVVGDRLYGRWKPVGGLSRQFLHASELSIRHPVANQSMNFQAPLPAELQAFLAASR